jgi:hypothetical protein
LKFIGGSTELQPKIDIEAQTPISALGCGVESLCAALKLSDIELLRKMLIVSEEVLRAGKSGQCGTR